MEFIQKRPVKVIWVALLLSVFTIEAAAQEPVEPTAPVKASGFTLPDEGETETPGIVIIETGPSVELAQPVPEEAVQHEEAGEASALPHAEDTKTWEKAYKFIKMFKFSTLWYLHYRYGHGPKDPKNLPAGYEKYNKFNISRGYLTLKITPIEWFGARITLDTHQDSEGDMKVRLKYLYAMFKAPIETKVLTEPYLEFGQVHMPWLDFEEHVNWYRCQGTMFMERSRLFNSADFGATFGMLLGPKLSSEYQKKVNGKYPGTWGSLAVGLYNGGGYHALEKNTAKAFEGRFTIRPLGFLFPYLQLSYFAIVGRGNIEETDLWDSPKWRTHAFMASIEHQYIVATGQFIMGRGNQNGDFLEWLIDTDPVTGEEIFVGIDKVYSYKGGSGFLEVKLPWIKSSLIGRYDWLEKDGKETQRIIGGYAFHFMGLHKNFILLDVDYVIPDSAVAGAEDSWEVKLTLQVKL